MSNDGTGLQVRIEIREGYVFVWQGGLAESVDELQGMQSQIERAMRAARTRVVMFDNRDTERPDEWIRASMWTWLSDNVERAALLQAVEKNKRRAEKTGERNRVLVRAFDDEAEAEVWLVGRSA